MDVKAADSRVEEHGLTAEYPLRGEYVYAGGVDVYTDIRLDTKAVAVSVVATVISHQRRHRRIIVDAGGLALSKDTSANAFVPDAGYGWVCDAATTQRIGDLRVATADQEHGFIEGANIPYDRLPIGSRVRILPNHACMTAAAYTCYAVVDGGIDVVDSWERVNGWHL